MFAHVFEPRDSTANDLGSPIPTGRGDSTSDRQEISAFDNPGITIFNTRHNWDDFAVYWDDDAVSESETFTTSANRRAHQQRFRQHARARRNPF
jgi:hypothetical protein